MKDDSPARINERLSVLTALPTLKNGSIGEALKSGFGGRDFMKWARTMTAFMALPASMAPTVARAAEPMISLIGDLKTLRHMSYFAC